MRLFAASALLSSALALSSPALAQYTVGTVRFDGTMPYSQADLQAASGLKPGDPLSTAQLQTAAQQLIDTGAFGDLQASLDGPFKHVTVIFKVKPADQLRPALFENFVWWQPEELVATLHARVPLFNGSIPEAGTLAATVRDSLTAMLAEKGIHAEVVNTLLDPAPGRPLPSAVYRIESPSIRLASFDLHNLSPQLEPSVRKALAELTDHPYSEGDPNTGAIAAVLNPYRDAGYLDVTLDHLTRTLDTSHAPVIDVKLAASLNPGDSFHVSSITWPGSPLISSEDFSKASHLHPGDIASREFLNTSVEVIQNAYRQHGYIDAGIDVTPTIDRSSHTVAYALTARPGELYHFDSVQVSGLTPDARRQFDSAWKLRPGEAYDGTYLTTFLKQNIAQPLLRSYTVKYRVETHPDTHLVGVVFDCTHNTSGKSSGQ